MLDACSGGAARGGLSTSRDANLRQRQRQPKGGALARPLTARLDPTAMVGDDPVRD